MCMIATTNLKGAIVLGWMCVTTFNVVWIGVLIKTPGWRLEVWVIHKANTCTLNLNNITYFSYRAEFIIAIVPATLISLTPFPLHLYGPSGFWW